MTDLSFRAYRDADAAPVAGLMNAIEAATGGGHRFSPGEIQNMITAAIKNPDLDTRLVCAADGALAAAGTVSPPAPGGSRAGVEGGVHPQWRGRGIGRDLLAWQLGRAAQMRADRDPGVTWTVGTGATVADDTAARLLRRFGLHPVRYFLDMSAPTSGDRPVRLPDGVRVSGYAEDMRAAVHDAHLEAFADHWGHEHLDLDEWAAFTVGSDLFRADLSRVALDGDQVAGYVLGYDGEGNQLHIGQVGTRRGWRGRGLATALMAQSLAAAAAAGKPTASLGVDADSPTGAVGVYERLGFSAPYSPFAVYEKELRA